MQTFSEQLASTRANLERLEALAAQSPELVDCATLVQVNPDQAQLFLHASRDPERDWRKFVASYKGAWQRENSVINGAWDYRGVVDGVDICIIGAEKRPEPQPLFVEEGTAA